ncbi:glycosyltransferase family 4 protein [Aerococcus urinaeequi]|uniref:glycosyltransferase family 4 protein n=1 Tax=Aerococcus urinaeequi TaxID=51665 RepID=UPI003ED8B18F
MNVLFISSGSDNSGSAHSLVTLAKLLKEEYNVSVTVVLARKGPIIKQLEKNTIDYHIIRHYTWIKNNRIKESFTQILKNNIKKLLNFFGEKKLKKLIRKRDIDIIHLNTVTTGFGSRVALNNSKKLVWHIREFMDLDLNYEFINSSKSIKLINKSDAIIAISESVKNHFLDRLDASKIHKIYNGINEKKYTEKTKPILSNDLVTMTIAGRLNEPKGQIDAIKATDILIKKGYKLKLQIVGDGDKAYENSLKSLVAENNLEEVVEFMGYVPDIHTIWRETDIGLVCSKAEAFGRVTVEAMMGEAIVVGADTKGTSELIGKDYGYTYKQGDYGDLSEIIEYVILRKEESRSIARKARKYAMNEFTAHENAKQIYKLYLKILNYK